MKKSFFFLLSMLLSIVIFSQSPSQTAINNNIPSHFAKRGLNGITGSQGPQGIQGVKGDKGDIGLTGPQGIQGVKGDKGDTGLTGPQGIQGVKGDKGDIGLTGPQGIQGVKGDKGDIGLTGPQGIQGVKGDKGDIGLTGPQGIQGVKGDKGDIGLTGPQGIQGVKGDKGDTGDDAPADGNGIYDSDGLVNGRTVTVGTSGLTYNGTSNTSSDFRISNMAEMFAANQNVSTPTITTTGWDAAGYRASTSFLMNDGTTIVRGEGALVLAPPNQATAPAGSVMTKQSDGTSLWQTGGPGIDYTTTEVKTDEKYKGADVYAIILEFSNLNNGIGATENLTLNKLVSTNLMFDVPIAGASFGGGATHKAGTAAGSFAYSYYNGISGISVKNETGFQMTNIEVLVKYTK